MAGKPLSEIVEAGWAQALAPVEPVIAQMGEFLRTELAAGRRYLPAGANVLRAFTRPFDEVRVLIVGQDPYPTPGHAVGLSFSVAPDVRPIPRSLANIYREYSSDLGHPAPSTGDLTPWAEHGVLLLNRVLTVEPGQPRLAPRQGLGGRHRAGDPRAGGPGGRAAGGDPLGSRRTEPDHRCWATCPTSSRRTRRRCRRIGASSVRGRSAASTRCWRSWAASRWTGSSPRAVIPR